MQETVTHHEGLSGPPFFLRGMATMFLILTRFVYTDVPLKEIRSLKVVDPWAA